MSSIDPSSLSNLSQVTTNSIHIDLTVDFETKALSGHVILNLSVKSDDSSLVVLDTIGLEIHSAALITSSGSIPLQFKMAETHKLFGIPLEISLDRPYNKGDNLSVQVNYNTTQNSAALQFLTPEQTKGKKHPFLFSQCQSIYARSLMPCQDSPSVKFTYTGSLRVPKPLTGLMGALLTSVKDEDSHTVYCWEQKVSIPSYLVALACGNLVKHEIGPRTAVWSEPELIGACAYEFAELEKIIGIAESIVTPYVWGRYDLLVLPPSFPYGGMENPCLTFVTPTMIAGDRSLVDLISHELAHSWSGNLVTTRNWEHFWLNEGWTTFFERQFTEKVSSRDTSQLLSVLGVEELRSDIKRTGVDNQLTNMVPCLKDIHPDDAFSVIPYEKGYNFLYYLKELLSHEVWQGFYKHYIHTFSGKSIDTDDFKNLLYSYVEKVAGSEGIKKLDSVDWEAWLYKPGMPPVTNDFDKTPQVAPMNLANKWHEADTKQDFSCLTKDEYTSLSTHQKLVFFSELKSKSSTLSPSALDTIDSMYSLNYNKNFEIRAAWLYVALAARHKPVFNAAVSMLEDQGRMKFTRPIYRLLAACKDEGGEEIAKVTFLRLEDSYHPICARLVKKDLGL
ncbi:hypothetical protein BB561_005803 [Smittium simulii]|uniref:Peptidase M1 leukotriene A4 hydrolase/aminopeptidase C-terminal domain-containing protein n=1 Tax=Smittium simulii TaxID=133385 RepID=A0A2T9Y848_9FUNG|nr:hypothetical protein BB561_005803 [Smittium simulii]